MFVFIQGFRWRHSRTSAAAAVRAKGLPPDYTSGDKELNTEEVSGEIRINWRKGAICRLLSLFLIIIP